jgi:hypothetical protein
MVACECAHTFTSLLDAPVVTMAYTLETEDEDGRKLRRTVPLSLDKQLETMKLDDPARVCWWVRQNDCFCQCSTTQTLAHIYMCFVPSSVDVERDFKCVCLWVRVSTTTST